MTEQKIFPPPLPPLLYHRHSFLNLSSQNPLFHNPSPQTPYFTIHTYPISPSLFSTCFPGPPIEIILTAYCDQSVSGSS